MNEETKCKHEDCERPATEILIHRPSEMMILDGEATANFVCGREGHTADNLRAQITMADPAAMFWTFHCGDAISAGQEFAALRYGGERM